MYVYTMNTATHTPTAEEATMLKLTARRITHDVRWEEKGMAAGFVSDRSWGVVDEAGRWLTFAAEGNRPWAVGTKAIAAEVAATIDLTVPGPRFVSAL